MQLLKLVFLCHGWMLGIYGRPLIRERIEAWKYGPVIPKLYHSVKQYGGGPITEWVEGRHDALGDEQKQIIDEVFEIYGDWSGPALSHLTHKPGSPWSQVFLDGAWGRAISERVIKKYYGQRAQAATE